MIEAVLPRAMFLVRLEDGRSVRVGASGPARHSVVRFLPGDVVSIRLSPYDPNRGQILKKF